MRTRMIANGDTKVWYDHEEEFIIINKNEPLYDTIIEANLLQKKYSKMLIKEVKDAGLNDIHGVFISIDDSLQTSLDKLNINELNNIFDSFNSIFQTKYKFRINTNGLKSIVFERFENYPEFIKNYFGTFLLKLFAFKVDILKSEEKNENIRGLSDFISRFVDDYIRIYLETSKEKKFTVVIR